MGEKIDSRLYAEAWDKETEKRWKELIPYIKLAIEEIEKSEVKKYSTEIEEKILSKITGVKK